MNPCNDHPDYPDRPEHADADLEEPGLSALYRQGATETPGSELDRRILDQARVALRPGPAHVRQSGLWPWRWLWPRRRSGAWHWRQVAIPLSSAAGLLLTVGLVLRVLEEQSAVEGISGMAPRQLAEDQPSPSTQPSQPISPSTPERGVVAKSGLEEASTLSAVARLSPPPSPAPVPISTLAPAPAIGTQAQVYNPPRDTERRQAIPMADRAGDFLLKSQITHELPQVHGELPQSTDETPQSDPERWLAVIRQRWSSGQRAEAIRQLTAFRQVHPRYPVPADLAPLMEAE